MGSLPLDSLFVNAQNAARARLVQCDPLSCRTFPDLRGFGATGPRKLLILLVPSSKPRVLQPFSEISESHW